MLIKVLFTIAGALKRCPVCGKGLKIDPTTLEFRIRCQTPGHGSFIAKGKPGDWRIEYELEE